MKHLLLLLLFTTSLTAQNSIRFGVFQDVKLATIGDNIGNEPFTPNVIMRSTWSGYEKNNVYLSVIIEYEFADLKGGEYHRTSAGLQLNFIEAFNTPFTLSPAAQFGWIARNGSVPFTGVGNIDVSYPIGNFELTAANQLTWRTELEKKKLAIAFFLGIQYNFPLSFGRK